MSRQYCKYHALEPAIWYSPQRHIAYCERCVDSSETLGGHGQARCFTTGEELEYLGSANLAQPFWDRLGAFFRYPLQKDSLVVIGSFVLLSWLVLWVFINSLPMLLIGALLLLACITRYGFMIIEHSAEGRFYPPTMQETFSGSGLGILFQQLMVQIIFAGFTVLVSLLNSEFLDVLANALVLFVAPASMMLLATEKSVAAAVSPARISHMIRSIGWSYLLLYGFLFLLAGSAAGLFDLFADDISPQLFLPVFIGLTLYFLMVGYHLMGYVIFQYQAELGFIAEDQAAKERRRRTVDPVDATSEMLVKDGQYQAAVKVLTKHLTSHPTSLRHHDHLSRLLLALEEKEQALAHGQRYLNVLNQLGDVSRLYFLYNTYCELDPSFKPEEPDVALSLAQQLFSRGKFREVIRLLANLHKTAPHYEGVPRAYLILTRALMDGFDQKQKASQYLQFIKARYPAFAGMSEVDQLLQQCRT